MNIKEIRGLVESILTEGDLTKYDFLGKDTLELMKNFVWRLSADVANAKKSKAHKTDPGATNVDQNIGKVKASSPEVKEIAQDVMLSLQTSVDELIKHFGAVEKKAVPLPPKRRSA